MQKQAITQPTPEDELELMRVVEEADSYVPIRGRKWRVGWMRNGTLSKLTALLLEHECKWLDKEGEQQTEALVRLCEEDNLVHRAVALLRLNSWWRIALFHGILWRWYRYICGYEAVELIPYILECKKKVMSMGYSTAITLLTEMKVARMRMTKAEAELTQAALFTAQLEAFQKNTES